MKWLIAIIAAVLQALLPWLVKQSKDTAQDGHPDSRTRDRLRDKVRKHWMIVLVFMLPIVLVGCGTRVVYIQHGTPVRLRETVKDVKVWVKDSNGQVVAGEMDLPEGWYCLEMPEEKE